MDVRSLLPIELLRLVNSTAAGEVISSRKLTAHRNAAGLRIGDKRLDLYKYTAWLFAQRHNAEQAVDAPRTYAQLAQYVGVTTNTVNKWRDNYADWPERNADKTFDLEAVEKFISEHKLGRHNPLYGMHGKSTSSEDAQSDVQTLMNVRKDFTTQRARREAAQATQAEIDLAKSAKDIVLISDVLDVYEQTQATVIATVHAIVDEHDRELPESRPSDDDSWKLIRERVLALDRKMIADIQTALQELKA